MQSSSSSYQHSTLKVYDQRISFVQKESHLNGL